jgi:phospholipid/cholesterol/gamma-HCH transport system substrate-binding protein
MKKLANLKVGITVLIGLIVFFFFVIIVGTQEETFTSTYRLKMFVTNINGLAENSMVTLGGLKIGLVKKMDFSMAEGRKGIIVTVEVERKYRNLITNNSDASIQTIGVLGDKYVDITIGKEGEKPLDEGDFLHVKPSFDLAETADELKNTLKDFSSTLAEVKVILDTIKEGKGSLGKLITSNDLYYRLSSVLSSMDHIVGAVQQKRGTLGKVIYEPDLYNQLTETTGDMKVISDSLKHGRGTLGKLVMEDSLYKSVRLMSDRINDVLSKAEDKSSSVGSLLNNGELYNQMSDLVKELKALIADIKKNPDKYFKLSVF